MFLIRNLILATIGAGNTPALFHSITFSYRLAKFGEGKFLMNRFQGFLRQDEDIFPTVCFTDTEGAIIRML
ncbi:MAG: hypothetical protein LBU22_04850 [Dysgonamonadaceae bacterium]|nr:hypothetical protein [Dysgonamonadaceae bacterium]